MMQPTNFRGGGARAVASRLEFLQRRGYAPRLRAIALDQRQNVSTRRGARIAHLDHLPGSGVDNATQHEVSHEVPVEERRLA